MLTKLKNLYFNYGYIFPLLVAFLLPFGINYAGFLIVWTCFYLFFGKPVAGFKAVFKNGWTYVLLAFFMIHVLAYFFTYNKAEALTSIEVKMSFFAFPLLIFCERYSRIQLKKIIISFVSGCFISVVICFFKATYQFVFNHVNAFFYSDFSIFLHPSYFAMYLILAQLIVMLFYKKWLSEIKILYLKIAVITFVFVAAIFLASSKMGLISAILILPVTFTLILISRGYKKTILILFCGLFAGLSVTYKVLPSPFERIKVAFTVTASSQKIDKTASESTAVRLLIWHEASKIVKQHLLFGVSPGDSNDKLYEAYRANGLTGALNKKLNAHNQFLQTFLGCGIFGFLILLLISAGLIVVGFVKSNYILLAFGVLVTLNFAVESMLQTQAGIVFYVFFLCIFLHYNLSELDKENKNSGLL